MNDSFFQSQDGSRAENNPQWNQIPLRWPLWYGSHTLCTGNTQHDNIKGDFLSESSKPLLLQPLDLVKTRMQVAKTSGSAKPSTLSVISGVIKNEGFTTLYNGLSAGLLRQATYTTTRLGIYTWLFEKFSTDGKPPNFFMKAGLGKYQIETTLSKNPLIMVFFWYCTMYILLFEGWLPVEVLPLWAHQLKLLWSGWSLLHVMWKAFPNFPT